MLKVAIPFLDGDFDGYFNALRTVGMEPVHISSADAEADCDALLLPGGADIDPHRFGEENNGSRGINLNLDELEFSVLDKYIKANKPVFGTCRGEQIINVYFGGTLIQDLDTADKHARIEGREQFHPVSIAGDTLLSSFYGERITVNSSHHQGVGKPGNGMRIIALSDDGVVEAVMHETLPVLGIQWHPERMLNAEVGKADGMKVYEWFKTVAGRCGQEKK